jgi:glucose-1-phosphate thymidylyltransferase
MSVRKGIVLAGGTGSRLHPVTLNLSKQLVPIYDKPMIYYPLSVLMLAGIGDICIITAPDSKEQFVDLLGDGSQWGISITYITQPSPDGLAQAYILAEEFLGGAPSAMVLGDNIFYGSGFTDLLASANSKADGGTVFGYEVFDPSQYGVVVFDNDGKAVSIVEKPIEPKSNFAVTGLYFLDGSATARAKTVRPSARGELEITSLLETYLDDGSLNVEIMSRGYAWLDTGTHSNLLDAGNFVRTLQQRQGLQVGCPEEIAFNNGWIEKSYLLEAGQKYGKTDYGQYLLNIAQSNS